MIYFFNDNLTCQKKLLFFGLVVSFIALNTAYLVGHDSELIKWLVVLGDLGLSVTTIALMALLTKKEVTKSSSPNYLLSISIIPVAWLGLFYLAGILFRFSYLSENVTIYNINWIVIVNIPLVILIGFPLKRKLTEQDRMAVVKKER